MNIHTEANKHLQGLDAFNVPNPIVAKAITLQRLLKAGAEEREAIRTINNFFIVGKK